MQKVSGFGGRELRLIFALERRKDQLFSVSDAKRILGSSDVSVWGVLKRLQSKGRVIRLQRGAYLFAPLRSGARGLWTEDAWRVVPLLVGTGEYYVGFVSAMNHWGMTEQLPVVVYVALTRQKRRLEAVQSRFVFVTKKRLGDFVSVKIGGAGVNVSSVEQTLLDGLSFPGYCGGMAGVARAIHFSRKSVDWDKLVRLAREDKSVVRRRLGFLLELLGQRRPAAALRADFAGFAWLDPSAQKSEFVYDKEWGLKVNVDRRVLLEFQEGY